MANRRAHAGRQPRSHRCRRGREILRRGRGDQRLPRHGTSPGLRRNLGTRCANVDVARCREIFPPADLLRDRRVRGSRVGPRRRCAARGQPAPGLRARGNLRSAHRCAHAGARSAGGAAEPARTRGGRAALDRRRAQSHRPRPVREHRPRRDRVARRARGATKDVGARRRRARRQTLRLRARHRPRRIRSGHTRMERDPRPHSAALSASRGLARRALDHGWRRYCRAHRDAPLPSRSAYVAQGARSPDAARVGRGRSRRRSTGRHGRCVAERSAREPEIHLHGPDHRAYDGGHPARARSGRRRPGAPALVGSSLARHRRARPTLRE